MSQSGQTDAVFLPAMLCDDELWGRQDRFSGVEHGVEMAARIPSARLVILEECGHLPTLERADDTVAAGREWLDVHALSRGR